MYPNQRTRTERRRNPPVTIARDKGTAPGAEETTGGAADEARPTRRGI
jgi:hypothetical protein